MTHKSDSISSPDASDNEVSAHILSPILTFSFQGNRKLTSLCSPDLVQMSLQSLNFILSLSNIFFKNSDLFKQPKILQNFYLDPLFSEMPLGSSGVLAKDQLTRFCWPMIFPFGHGLIGSWKKTKDKPNFILQLNIIYF